jgi:hypothetical protein
VPLFHDTDALIKKLQGGTREEQALARDIAHGKAVVGAGKAVGRAGKAVGRAAAGVGSVVAAPANTVGPHVLDAVGSAGKFFARSPKLTAAALLSTAALPAYLDMTGTHADTLHGDIMRARELPENSLPNAPSVERFKISAAPSPVMGAVAGKILEGVLSGVGHAVYGGLASGVSAVHNALFQDPKRKQLLEGLLKNDPVLSDSVKRNPNAQTLVLEAYGTMSKFAPTLSLDINAVRSFLREAVLSGSGVSYAAIKNLIETEQALKGRGGKK